MKTTHYLVSIGLLLGAWTPAFAQNATVNTCNGKEPVGYLGISGIDCDCTIATPGSGRAWRFRSEPKITSLETDSRAGAVLKIGDVITHVNGHSIKTDQGAEALAELEPGDAVVLTVRRNGQSLKFALTAESVCSNDTRLYSIYAPGNRSAPNPYPRATPVPPTRPGVAASGGVGVAPSASAAGRPGATPVPPVAPRAYATMPKASFGMGLSCSGNCSMEFSDRNGTATMRFSQPPEVYSIEKGGPADNAGIRRGDILSHINSKPMDSQAAGELFANAKPGQAVTFTIRRGNERKTVSVRAAQRTTPMPALAQSTEALVRAREALTDLQRDQNAQLRRLQETLSASGKLEQDKLREVQRELLREERVHTEKLAELARELSHADGRMRVATGSAGATCPVPMQAPTASSTLSRTLRYSGTLGESDIEVRGNNLVSVTENKDEVVITTGGTVVRVKKNKN